MLRDDHRHAHAPCRQKGNDIGNIHEADKKVRPGITDRPAERANDPEVPYYSMKDVLCRTLSNPQLAKHDCGMKTISGDIISCHGDKRHRDTAFSPCARERGSCPFSAAAAQRRNDQSQTHAVDCRAHFTGAFSGVCRRPSRETFSCSFLHRSHGVRERIPRARCFPALHGA